MGGQYAKMMELADGGLGTWDAVWPTICGGLWTSGDALVLRHTRLRGACQREDEGWSSEDGGTCSSG